MRKIITWLVILFKRQLKKVSLYVILAILVLACISIRYVAQNFSVTIEIGVVNQDKGNVSAMIEKGLYEHNGLVAFVKYDSRAELIEAVQSGSVYGGYVIKPEFSKKLLKGDNDNIIEAFSTPNSLISGISNEMFFSFVMKELSYEELVKDTLDTGLFKALSEEEIRRELREYYELNLANGSTFSLAYENTPKNYEGKFTSIDILDYISPVITGLIGLMIFIGGLCGSLSYYDDRKNGSLALLKPVFRQLVAVIETAVPVLVITAVGIFILIVTGMETNVGAIVVKYIIYGLIVIVYCYLLKTIIRRKEIFVSFIPVLSLMSVFFCPIFTNIAAVSPLLAGIGKTVPLYWLYYI